MAKNHGAPEAGKHPGPRQEVVERAAQRIRSWTVQREIRGVLGRVSAGAT